MTNHYKVTSDDATRGRVSVSSVVDGSSSQFVGLRVAEFVIVSFIEDAVGVNGAGADGKHFAVGASAVGVDVVKSRSLGKRKI